MVFWHPFFTILTIVLMIYSFMEVYNSKNYKSVWVVVWLLVILIGLRIWVGADYKQYYEAFRKFGKETSFTDVFYAAIELGDNMDMEWLYVLIGKIIYSIGLPFFIFTLVVAAIAIPLKYLSFTESVAYPVFAFLLYMYPTLFISDGGQMRQGVAMAVILFSFRYIKSRNMIMFLITMFLAMGFHQSAIVFVPVYWLVTFPMNSTRIILVVLVCMALSPLKLYQYFSAIEALSTTDTAAGFRDYDSADIDTSTRFVKLPDLVNLMYVYFMVAYDKQACKKIPYYEYMRNIGVLGVCLYFIFRENMIFSTRLVNNILIYMPMVLVSIVAAMENERLKKSLHFVLIAFVVFLYFVYANTLGYRTGYVLELYLNILWNKW